MSIAKSIEICAESATGFDEAIKEGVRAAGTRLENIHGVWVKDQEVEVENGEITSWRVWLKVTFRLK